MIKISSLSQDWTEIEIQGLSKLKFLDDSEQEIKPNSITNANFRNPPIINYNYNGFTIQIQGGLGLQKANVKIRKFIRPTDEELEEARLCDEKHLDRILKSNNFHKCIFNDSDNSGFIACLLDFFSPKKEKWGHCKICGKYSGWRNEY